ncbi:MAG: RraA family protein [Acidimicrobiales bacterium]
MPPTLDRALIDGLAAADVVDALTRSFEHRAHLIDLVSPDPTKVLFGPAVTVGFLPVRKDLMDPHRHSLGPAIYGAIGDRDPTDRVLVMSSGGHPGISLGGSTKLSRVTNHGLAGVLCDGRLRDFDELANAPGAFYCRGEAIRAGGNVIQPFVTDAPVVVDGVTIVPGDVIFADTTGAAVIPADQASPVLELAQKIKTMAGQMAEKIRHEDPAAVLRDGSQEA